MMEKSERDQLDKAWIAIRSIWVALLGSLAIYVLVCKLAEDQLKPMTSGFSLETIKTVLYVVTAITLVGAFFIRRSLLAVSTNRASVVSGQTPSIQHPSAVKYMIAIIVAMALCETIGIYGIITFFLSKDWLLLFQFISISAIAMFFYRPRKEEFLQLAEDMKKKDTGRRL